MTIIPHLITGVGFGIEYVPPDVTDEGDHILLVDIGIIRLLFCWMPKE